VLFPLYVSSVNAFIPFGAFALGVILYTLFHPSIRRQAESEDAVGGDVTGGVDLPPGDPPDPAPPDVMPDQAAESVGQPEADPAGAVDASA